MCGIALIFGDNADKYRDRFSLMLTALESRGEVTETFNHPDVLAGTRRLKIVDGERSQQPIFNVDRDKFIVFNGEVFNFKEIRDRLPSKYTFTTEGDTETVLYAFEEYGEKCLDLFEGQFAFAIVDLKENRVFFARDGVGIIPLYFVETPEFLYLASNIKALTHIGEPIQALSPGCFRWNDRPEVRYFQTHFHTSNRPLDDFLPHLKQTLVGAIERRTQTDLPIGVIYSGGLDSSIVLSQTIKFHPRVTAFTVGCESSEDFAISQRFCRDYGISQEVISLTPRDFSLQDVKQAIQLSELTEYGDLINAAISVKLFQRIRDAGIKVVLGGDGSDELFGGYDMYGLELSPSEQQQLFLYKFTNLHRTELQRVDRCGMAFGIETRVPFLAKDVIELALETPKHWKIKDGREKWCLRQAFKDELPDYILNRRKNPLSHSSGLHEGVRRYKWFFKQYYEAQRYNLHDRLKKDFSYVLAEAGYQVAPAIEAAKSSQDYSRSYLILEGLKATARTLFAS